MDTKVTAALEAVNNWSTIPINEVLANYFANDTAIPDLRDRKAGVSVSFFIRELADSHQEQILKLIFLDNIAYRHVLNSFFASARNHPDLIAAAYKYAVPNTLSDKEFLERMLYSTEQESILEKDGKPTKFQALLKKDKAMRIAFFETIMAAKKRTFYLITFADFLNQNCPDLMVSHLSQMIREEGSGKGFNFTLVNKLLAVDLARYEDLIYKELNGQADFLVQQTKYPIVVSLYRTDKKKYKDFFLAYIYKYLDYFTKEDCYPFKDHTFVNRDIERFNDKLELEWWAEGSFSLIYWVLHHLKEISVKDFEVRLKDFCKNTAFMPKEIIPLVKDHFKEDAIGLFVDILAVKNHVKDFDYPQVLIESFDGLAWESNAKELWKYAAKQKFQIQAKVVNVLAKKPDVILPFAKAGMTKAKSERLLSYLIFANLERTKQSLWNYFQKEKDDNVREFILPIVKRIFYKEDFDLEQVNELVQYAVDRDAYKKGLKGVILDFDQLPDIYLENGKKLDEKQVKFLIYRMSNAIGMQSDVEAKLLINHIDKSKSSEFAKAILEAFLDKGAPAKQKYIMSLAGILGDEGLLGFLQKLFKDLHDGKRLQMAKYVISTIAMIGTDKALRHVEYISRKYKKKASLQEAAVEALENAAEELGIDMFELSDRIIPDFGFDGLYKTIDVEGEELRVFVAKDFKLQFITEDGKVRKSVPKAAGKELKAELKKLQKEIREVNRAQKERLEQYMVLERRWDVDNWTKFYLMNPVMFIYASTLVWGVFDENNKLQKLFYVDEDASLMDLEDDDVEIEKGKIGIVHPLRLTEKQKIDWSKKFYEQDIIQPYQQLERPSFALNDVEQTSKEIVRYNGKGAAKGNQATQGYFERRGWRKEVSDGGCFDFSKTFKQEGMYAFLSLEGLCIGWYDEKVKFHNIYFLKEGEYSWNGEKNIPLKDVPEIVLSEVIADMEGIVEQEDEGKE